MNLILIGYRGTGKTTVARLLGARLGWEWIDADVELELRAGKSIEAIFADEGEAAFRDLESAVLADLVERDSIVLATGGGIVVRPGNRKLLAGAGKVIWLTASVETIVKRLSGDATTLQRRPALTAHDPATEVARLLSERTLWYRQAADWTVDTEGKSPSHVAEEILQLLSPSSPPESE